MASLSDPSSQRSLTFSSIVTYSGSWITFAFSLPTSSRLSASNYEWTVDPPKSSMPTSSFRAWVLLR